MVFGNCNCRHHQFIRLPTYNLVTAYCSVAVATLVDLSWSVAGVAAGWQRPGGAGALVP
jgi:hypothetical protein